MDASIDYSLPVLCDLRTGEPIRNATAEEQAESQAAGENGAIEVEIDGETRVCFVQD